LTGYISRYNDGDASAFDDIYKRCATPLAFLCQKFCENKEDAEEVMQDTFVIAFKKPRDLRGDTLLAYLKKIAIHECFRKRKVQRQQQSFVLFSLDEEIAEIPDADEDFLPEESLRNKEQQDELIQIINTLSKNQREMTYLYYYFNFNAEEIARLYNCSSGVVRVNLQRARQAIRNKLEGRNSYMGRKASVTALVALGALFLIEESVFAASYIPATACAGSTALAAGTTSAAVMTSTASVASFVKGCMVAACLVGVGVVGTLLYLSVDEAEPLQSAYEIAQDIPAPTEAQPAPIVLPHATATEAPTALPTEIPTAPSIEIPANDDDGESPPEAFPSDYLPAEEPYAIAGESAPEPPLHDPIPHSTPPSPQPTPPPTLPNPTEPPATQPPPTTQPPTSEPTSPPNATTQPETQPETTLAPPTDRTQAILASLANATTEAAVASIIEYYGFADAAFVRTLTGMIYRFYVLDEGSGEIAIGIGTYEDGSGWHMRFDLFAGGQLPEDIMQRVIFMQQ